MSSYSLSLERFVGKVAVVTGASAGIGKSIAEALVKEGLTVAGLARRVQRVSDLAEQLNDQKGKLYAFQCDLSKQDEILATFKKITTELGPIYILVNNAGLLHADNIIGGDIEKWKPALDINVLALAICIREAVASMKAHDTKGHIININSVAGHTVLDMPGNNLYSASKHAVTAITETVRLEINREKLPIKITSISPGAVKTEFVEAAFCATISKAFEQRPSLQASDIKDAAMYVLSTPDYVNVTELTVVHQGQLY